MKDYRTLVLVVLLLVACDETDVPPLPHVETVDSDASSPLELEQEWCVVPCLDESHWPKGTQVFDEVEPGVFVAIECSQPCDSWWLQ